MTTEISYGQKYPKEILNYFFKEKLDKFFPFDNRTKQYSAYHGVKKNSEPYPAEIDDLVRLHKLIRKRKVFSILEFGVGYSTIVMADAIRKNELEYKKLKSKPEIRNSNKFKIISLDSSKAWIAKASKLIPRQLKKYIDIKFSEVYVDTFNDRFCHFYKKLPDIIPDFIYVDGPSNLHVKGSKNGLSYKNLDRTIMMADLLLMEPTFLPGTLILFDGRTNNARFIKNNFQRKFKHKFHSEYDISTFELIEEPIGKYNYNQIHYCLGKKFLKNTIKV